jgi:outer membrane protein OmpA-like peptidoglycan-associated protein
MAVLLNRFTGFRRIAGAALVAALFAAGASLTMSSPAAAQNHHFGGRGGFGHGFGGHGYYGGRGRYGHGWYGRPGWGVGIGLGYGYYGWPYYPAYYGYPYYYAPYPYPYYAQAAVYAPPPRVAMAPHVRQFTVYFQFDRYELTASAREVVDAAIAAARAGGPARIEVVGNTDLAGTGRYNQVLSRRRADMVRNYMIAHGIDPGMIGIRALGKTDPAVRTADGVREPRNRRVEIVIHPLGGNAPPATSMRQPYPYPYGRPYTPANATMAPPPYGGPPPNGAEPPAGPPTNLVSP